jgi:hypothetical protein
VRIFCPIWASTGVAPLLEYFDDFAMVRNPILHSDDALKLHKPHAASKAYGAGRLASREGILGVRAAKPSGCSCCSHRRSAAGYWFLWARCPACRTTGDVDLRTLDWHCGAAVTALARALSCRACRPNAPFAELVCLSKSSVAEEYYAEHSDNSGSASETVSFHLIAAPVPVARQFNPGHDESYHHDVCYKFARRRLATASQF